MKNHSIRILSAFIGFAALAISAKAQTPDNVVVKVPFEFVVGAKTLPAGTYTVKRANDRDDRVLIIDNFDNHAAVLVVTSEAKHTLAEKSSLSFQQVGDQRLLMKIETASNIYTIPVSESAILQAAAKSQSQTATRVTGGRGGN